MDDKDKKDNLLADMLADKGLREGEGAQWIAYNMLKTIRTREGKPDQPFVYKQPEPGWKEQSYADSLRRQAKEVGGNSLLTHMAEAWDQAAENKRVWATMPKWKKWIVSTLSKIYRR